MKIVNKMYSGNVELIFDTTHHQYSVNGKIINGVTSILQVIAKPQLLYWSANMAADYFRDHITPGKSLDEIEIESLWKEAKRAHTKKKEDAGSIGHLVHDFVDKYCKKEQPPMPINEQAKLGIDKFLEWIETHKVKFLVNETPCFSKKFEYAGTIDGICRIDGKLYIFDLKTSNAIRDEYYLQVAAYLNARIEEFPNEKYDGVIILRVGKEEGEVEFITKTIKEVETFYRAFLFALGLKKSLDSVAVILGENQ